MKTTKLFFALAIAAGLAACTKDALVEPENAVVSFEEIKGGKLLANGFAIDPIYDGEALTKIGYDETNGAYWEKGEEIGVAWFVAGALTDDQSKKKLSDVVDNNTYANHKLINSENGSNFKSNSNVFEGWHIAYHPYKVLPRPQELKEIVVNPSMAKSTDNTKAEYAKEQLENMPKFSIGYLVNDTDVVDGVIQKNMPIVGIANVVRPKFTVAEDILAQDALSNLQIASIQLSLGEAAFLNELAVVPANFPDGSKSKPSFDETYFGDGADKAFKGEYSKSVTTNVVEPCSLNSGNLNFRTFMAPVPESSLPGGYDKAKVSVKVNLVGGSYFTIKYKAVAGEDDVNNKAIKKFVELLNGDFDSNGKKYSLQKLDATPFSLDFELRMADFSTSYTVDSYAAWVTNVDLATALGKDAVSFTIKTGSEVIFPAGDMYTNDINITLTASDYGYLVFNDESTWSSDIILGVKKGAPYSKVGVKVGEAGKLVVNDDIVTGRVYNHGTLDLNGAAVCGQNDLTNTGIINLALGSKLINYYHPASTGKVVYTVEGNETATDITGLMTNAELNTLVVEKDWTLEAAADFTGVTVEMKGANVTANAGFKAAALNIVSGENTFSGNIAANVSVAEDAILAMDGNITGNLTINGDVTINTTDVVEGGRLVITGDITNKGVLTVNGGEDVYVNNLVFTNATSTTVKDCILYYYNNYSQGGTTQGVIKKADVTSGDGYELINGTYYVKNSVGFANVMSLAGVKNYNLVLENDVVVSNYTLGTSATETIVIEGNSYTITFNQSTIDKNPITTANNATLTIKNAVLAHTGVGLDGNYYQHALCFHCPVDFTDVVSYNAILVTENTDFTNVLISDEADAYGLWIEPYGQEVNLTGCTFNMVNGRGIKVEEINADPARLAKPELTISGTTFVTKKKSAVLVHVKPGVVINWGANNDISEVEADSVNAIWVDEAMNHTDYLLNVKVNGTATVIVEGQK